MLFPILSGNMLKLLAALFMLIDHIGVILFPEYIILRIIGRLSYPLFAFKIAEGCYYTKNKTRYFLLIFSLGFLCQIIYYIFDRSLDMGILITFSISIILIYALDNFKQSLNSNPFKIQLCILNALAFILLILIDFWFCKMYNVDYGFLGTLCPVFAFLFRENKNNIYSHTPFYLNIITFSIGILVLSISLGGIQFYSLFSLPLLLMYSGKRGKRNMKYFFYIFYPTHFIILYLISFMI